MNEEARLDKRLDENGKITVTDDMSEDLKMVINYLNDHNINYYTELDDPDIDDEDLESDDYDMESGDESFDDSVELDDDASDDLEETKTKGESSDLNDLNNLF